MGNKVLIKGDSRVALPLQEFVNLMLACGVPKTDINLVHTNGENMEYLLTQCNLRMTQFTGSSKVANRLCRTLNGKIKIEDAGLDWKILGPDVSNVDVISSICDQDAYAISGQKCSAQSLIFAHKNWMSANILEKIKNLAEARSIKKLTLSPVMTWSNSKIQAHVDAVLKISGAQLLFGGSPVKENHSIPEIYGSYLATAIFVPLKAFSNKKHFELLTTELFGPFQIITEYNNIDDVLPIVERIEVNLTAGVVSNDSLFLNKVLGRTVNGVTYSGI
jgi:1-pyrroline-5-carboxylate dehydrogenase